MPYEVVRGNRRCALRGACPVRWVAPFGLFTVRPRARALTGQEWAVIRNAPDAFHDPALRVAPKPDSFGILDARVVVTKWETPMNDPTPFGAYVLLAIGIVVVVYGAMWVGGQVPPYGINLIP